MKFNYFNEAIRLEPDIIIAHNYRHMHTTQALKVVEELRKRGKKVKIFLVTHEYILPNFREVKKYFV